MRAGGNILLGITRQKHTQTDQQGEEDEEEKTSTNKKPVWQNCRGIIIICKKNQTHTQKGKAGMNTRPSYLSEESFLKLLLIFIVCTKHKKKKKHVHVGMHHRHHHRHPHSFLFAPSVKKKERQKKSQMQKNSVCIYVRNNNIRCKNMYLTFSFTYSK